MPEIIAGSEDVGKVNTVKSRTPQVKIVFGPGTARYHDHTLGVYEAAGFSPDDADRAATTVFTFVLGSALGPAAATSMHRKLQWRGESGEARLQEAMAHARDVASQFPRLAARLGSPGAAYAASPEASFEFGLAAVLDGLGALLPSQSAEPTDEQ